MRARGELPGTVTREFSLLLVGVGSGNNAA
jgi:hypothetical protein